MSDDSKKERSVPSWQQAATQKDGLEKAADGIAKASELSDDLVDVARQFLQDPAIKDAPRDEKVEFLKAKGLEDDMIEKLLSESKEEPSELKTVHDSTTPVEDAKHDFKAASAPTTTAPPPTPQNEPRSASLAPRSDVPPIITYPEFLLKPEKPPPLITVSRLVNAAYIFAGVSAITYGASKYLVQPMLQTLTEARHDFAESSLQDLEKLNEKLEGMVSHVPYIASIASKRQQEHDDDVESVVSDPTELFHRDMATQTTPSLSRRSSTASLTRHNLDPAIAQAERLSGLSYSIQSLVQSVQHSNENEKYLQKTVEDFQKKLDNMESTYGMLRNDYYGSSGIYASATGDAKKASSKDSEAQKFKQEIRALKGAFLSSRNFPTATRTGVVASGYGARGP